MTWENLGDKYIPKPKRLSRTISERWSGELQIQQFIFLSSNSSSTTRLPHLHKSSLSSSNNGRSTLQPMSISLRLPSKSKSPSLLSVSISLQKFEWSSNVIFARLLNFEKYTPFWLCFRITNVLTFKNFPDLSPPVRARGVKSRMCPPYPQRDRKRRLNGAVCRNHRIKRVVPCRC